MKKQFLTYQELNEALKLSQYRDYHDIRPKNIEDKLSELFKGKNRIYIPFEYKVTDKDIKKDYHIIAALHREGYTITNYLEGYCEKDGRTFRIGKILNKLNLQDLLKIFNEDPNRAVQNKNFLICISKHPYDIAGMSTDRGWTSCMNLENGEPKDYIEGEIKEGTVIAYLINEEDVNINHPYGRINIKPYLNQKDDIAWGLSKFCYGSILDEKEKPNGLTKKFKNTVSKWVNKNLNVGIHGVYYLNKKIYKEAVPLIKKGDKESLEYKISSWEIDVRKLKDGVYNGDTISPKDLKEFKGFEELFGFEIKKVKGDLTFDSCTSLTSVSNLPGYVGGHLTFAECKSLTSVSNFPEYVGNNLSFFNCKSLTSVSNLPEYVEDHLTFSGCASLTSIGKMPSVVKGYIYTAYCPFFEGMNEVQIRQKYNISRW